MRRGGDRHISKNKSMKAATQSVNITPPNITHAVFHIEGTSPLVIHRFSTKAKNGMLDKMAEGTVKNKGKKEFKPTNTDDTYNEARYISKQGWDGFNVSSIRNAIIRACSLVNIKMTLAKLSLFVEADGRDAVEPEFGLIRIIGKPRKLEMVARVETGQAYVCVRPIYDEWSAKLRISFDADQFSLQDVTNLLARAGAQVGIGEGRNFSKNSAGMGWGSFKIVNTD
jgi:hypothetical protein